MNTFIMKNTRPYGPYTDSQIENLVESGEFTGQDLGWREGYAKAIPLSQIVGEAKPPFQYSPEDLVRIATLQKILIAMVVALVPLTYFPVPSGVETYCIFAAFAFHVFGMIAAIKLAHGMRRNVRLYLLATAFPIVNLVCFSHITTEATFILRFNGVRTGLAGASRKEMQRFGNPGPNTPWNPPHTS